MLLRVFLLYVACSFSNNFLKSVKIVLFIRNICDCDIIDKDSFFYFRYLRLPVEEVKGLIIDSSIDRMETFCSFPAPKTKEDVIKMLGDRSGKRHCVFWENGGEEVVKTVAVGMQKHAIIIYSYKIECDFCASQEYLIASTILGHFIQTIRRLTNL